MKESVMIKSSPNGLTLTLDKSLSFEQLVQDTIAKFKENEAFFSGSKFAIEFKGKKLTEPQQQEMVAQITANTGIAIICIMSNDEKENEKFLRAVKAQEEQNSVNTGKFYKGTLRSGQILESESSIIILGDVNPGAKVVANGNIVVLGALRGTAYAGVSGNSDCFVAAVYMDPIQIRIADAIGRKSDGMMMYKKVDKNLNQPMIAQVEDQAISLNVISKGMISSF